MEEETPTKAAVEEIDEETLRQQIAALAPETRAGWTELIASIILALATVATAWSGYQAARWGGVQSTRFAEASTARIESVRASTSGGQKVQVDIGLFTEWINAFAEGDERRLAFYQQRFRAEFVPAFDAWLATDPANNSEAPKTPFVMPQYEVSDLVRADELSLDASRKFDEANEANETSDRYILNTVILASVLFFAGLINRFKSNLARLIILLAAIAMFMVGLSNLFRYPIE
ncbi:MAG: hypothetical protein R3335_06490 [Anaerolineales bacterium]|nr:hypothetical protein [Anaerolineales bacterium]